MKNLENRTKSFLVIELGFTIPFFQESACNKYSKLAECGLQDFDLKYFVIPNRRTGPIKSIGRYFLKNLINI